MADASTETVMAELDAGETGTIELGPFLFTNQCKNALGHSYKVLSSTYSGSVDINLNFKIRNSAMKLKRLKIDQDMPGHSIKERDKNIGEAEAFELLLYANLSSDYQLFLNNLKALPEEFTSPLKNISTRGLPFTFLKSSNVHQLKNDLDFSTLKGDEWDTMIDSRSIDRATSSTSVYKNDRNKLWFHAKFTYVSSCKSSADFLPAPLDVLYGGVCEKFTYEEFKEWLNTIYQDACKTSNMKQKIEAKLKEESIDQVMKKKLNQKDEGKDDNSNSMLSKQFFLDPSYESTMMAIDTLVFYNVISPEDLDKALRYADTLYFEKVPSSQSRELGRQLLLAAYMSDVTAKSLGVNDLKQFSIFKQGSTIGIKKLEQSLLKLRVSESIANEEKIKNSSNLNIQLQKVVQKLMKEGQCLTDEAPLPEAPPREVRTVSKYFNLPISTQPTKEKK